MQSQSYLYSSESSISDCHSREKCNSAYIKCHSWRFLSQVCSPLNKRHISVAIEADVQEIWNRKGKSSPMPFPNSLYSHLVMQFYWSLLSARNLTDHLRTRKWWVFMSIISPSSLSIYRERGLWSNWWSSMGSGSKHRRKQRSIERHRRSYSAR